jgi:hypothetical protein
MKAGSGCMPMASSFWPIGRIIGNGRVVVREECPVSSPVSQTEGPAGPRFPQAAQSPEASRVDQCSRGPRSLRLLVAGCWLLEGFRGEQVRGYIRPGHEKKRSPIRQERSRKKTQQPTDWVEVPAPAVRISLTLFSSWDCNWEELS